MGTRVTRRELLRVWGVDTPLSMQRRYLAERGLGAPVDDAEVLPEGFPLPMFGDARGIVSWRARVAAFNATVGGAY